MKRVIRYCLITIYLCFPIWVTNCSMGENEARVGVETLVEQLKKGDRYEQAKAYIDLEKIEDPKILPLLVDVLNSPKENDNARSYAATLISKMAIRGNEDAILELQQALKNEHLKGNPRESVISGLINLRDLAVPGLVDILVFGKGEDVASMSAMEILAQIKSDITISSLIEALKVNDDEDIRSAISLTLVMIGQKSVPKLIPLLKSENKSLKECAWSTLTMITGEDFDMDYSSWEQYRKTKQ